MLENHRTTLRSISNIKITHTSYICPPTTTIRNSDEEVVGGDNVSTGSAYRCPYLVSFYGAYHDQESNTLNLVHEYMNAGSIQKKINEKIIFSENDAAVLAYSVLRAPKTHAGNAT